jgi:hypothetical protein
MADQPKERRKPAERQAALSMRIASATRDKLVARAAANGRSVTQEADRMLHVGQLMEELVGNTGLSPTIAVMTDCIAAGTARAGELGVEGDWTQNVDCAMPAALAAVRTLIQVFGAVNIDHWPGLFEQALISEHRRRSGRLPGGFVDQGRIEPITVELPDHEVDGRPGEAGQTRRSGG